MMIREENRSKLGFGCARLPLLDEHDQGNIDYPLFSELVDAYIARGGCYFDTAYMYHAFQSELAVGKVVVDRYPREKLIITSKLPVSMLKSGKHQDEIFTEQLDKCHVDYFDVYLLHSLMENNLQKADEFNCYDFILKKKEEGRIRHIGISFHGSPKLLQQILELHPKIEYVQLQINYLDWLDPIVQSKACYDVAKSFNKSVIVMEPIRGGTLANVPQNIAEIIWEKSGFSPAAFALKFAASLDNVNYVLSGMSAIEQVTENVELLCGQSDICDEHIKLASWVADCIRKTIAIHCTACHYCTSGCPMNIPIPEYFSLYNSYRYTYDHDATRKNIFINQKHYYSVVMKNYPRASECLACGQCEYICPQHIKCIEELKKIADCFEK